MKKKTTYKSEDGSISLEPYSTNNTTWYLYRKSKIEGRVYIRGDGSNEDPLSIEVEIHNFTDWTKSEINSLTSLTPELKKLIK